LQPGGSCVHDRSQIARRADPAQQEGVMTGRYLATVALAACVALAGMPGDRLLAQGARPGPPRADALVTAATKTAAEGHKVVLIEFGASWCTWCRSFEAFVHSPEVGQIVAANYVLVNLTVQEQEDKKALENPGGQDAMNTWGGAKSGLPFYVFLDATGKKIADSNAMPDGTNIGFPATAQELQMFMGLIDKTAPRMTKAERSKILDYLGKTVKP
jgi:thiol:disulfide interchange protein